MIRGGFIRRARWKGIRCNAASPKKVSHRLQSLGPIGNNQTKVAMQHQNVLEELFSILPYCLCGENCETHWHDLLVGIT
jgi:hypothetical protein